MRPNLRRIEGIDWGWLEDALNVARGESSKRSISYQENGLFQGKFLHATFNYARAESNNTRLITSVGISFLLAWSDHSPSR